MIESKQIVKMNVSMFTTKVIETYKIACNHSLNIKIIITIYGK